MNEADQDPIDKPGKTRTQKSRSTRVLVSTFLAASALVVTIDVLTKTAAVHWLTDAPPKAILNDVLYFNLTRNPGAAFSMAVDYTWVLSIIATIVVIVLLALSVKIRNIPWALTLGLVLGGAAGNLMDRIFREPGFMEGHVVDFVSVFDPAGRAFPIFNMADSALVLGVIFVIFLEFTGRTFTAPIDPAAESSKEHESVESDSPETSSSEGSSDATKSEESSTNSEHGEGR